MKYSSGRLPCTPDKVKTEPGSAVLAVHAISYARGFMRERPFDFDSRNRAAAAGHSGLLISFGNLAVTGRAYLTPRLGAHSAIASRTISIPHTQKSSRAPTWPVRLPLTLVTCPNNGLVMRGVDAAQHVPVKDIVEFKAQLRTGTAP